jgi:MoaA/NifB/PqqE/SkfB family radical SAM enzyme
MWYGDQSILAISMLWKAARWGFGATRVARANVSRLSSPFKLTFALTYWCQYRCKTCNIWSKRPEDELSTAEVFSFIDQTRDVSWLDVTGGEIFLRNDIADILERILDRWQHLILLHFPTNGFQTDRIVEVVARLAHRSPARIVVTVSLDGDEALNDQIRGVKGGYRRQIETFRRLRSMPGVTVALGMTLSKLNSGRFEDTFAACRRDCPGLTIEDFHLNVAQLSPHFYANTQQKNLLGATESIIHDLALYRGLRPRARTLAGWLEQQYLVHLEAYLRTGRTPARCHALRSSCFIDPWGTVYPCITYDRPLGNLRQTGMRLDPIWTSDTTRRQQHEIWNGNCPQCWTACEAYPTILGNLVRRVPSVGARPRAGQATCRS